jgi:ribosomal protein S18 acetylase RimI-like enzyme
MYIFSNANIRIAGIEDKAGLVALLNSAYRGETSKQGWTTEAHLIGGTVRTDESELERVMNSKGSVLLKYTNDEGNIIGCVNLQQHSDKVYLGMLSVLPGLQGGGIGKQLLKAAEEYAQESGCSTIYMTVISVRTELINWYQRHGYKDTGERKKFIEDGKSGNHLQPLEFMVMEKLLPL